MSKPSPLRLNAGHEYNRKRILLSHMEGGSRHPAFGDPISDAQYRRRRFVLAGSIDQDGNIAVVCRREDCVALKAAAERAGLDWAIITITR